MKYRKKPVVIEAYQFKGSSSEASAIRDWMETGNPPMQGGMNTCDIQDFKIETLEGTMTASSGDWIVKGIQGEFYAVKPDIFQETYEEVS